jgi:hypothetical protein
MWIYFIALIAIVITVELLWRYIEPRIPENIDNRYDDR